MKDLFYSPTEKTLFWIAGYTDNSNHVKDIVSMLNNNYNYFFKLCNNPQIRTDIINNSIRYKYCRYFWATVEKPPEEAFEIGEDWTMDKWICS